MSEWTMRERMLALVQGRDHDRVPFVEYSGISGSSNDEVWSVIGRNNMGLLIWCGLFGSCTVVLRKFHVVVVVSGGPGFTFGL